MRHATALEWNILWGTREQRPNEWRTGHVAPRDALASLSPPYAIVIARSLATTQSRLPMRLWIASLALAMTAIEITP
jgi:hypothetical protein